MGSLLQFSNPCYCMFRMLLLKTQNNVNKSIDNMKALHLKILLSHCFSTFFLFRELQICSYIDKFWYIYIIKINKKPPVYSKAPVCYSLLNSPRFLFSKTPPNPPSPPPHTPSVYSGPKGTSLLPLRNLNYNQKDDLNYKEEFCQEL